MWLFGEVRGVGFVCNEVQCCAGVVRVCVVVSGEVKRVFLPGVVFEFLKPAGWQSLVSDTVPSEALKKFKSFKASHARMSLPTNFSSYNITVNAENIKTPGLQSLQLLEFDQMLNHPLGSS